MHGTNIKKYKTSDQTTVIINLIYNFNIVVEPLSLSLSSLLRDDMQDGYARPFSQSVSFCNEVLTFLFSIKTAVFLFH